MITQIEQTGQTNEQIKQKELNTEKQIINFCGWCGCYLEDYKINPYCLCLNCQEDLKQFEKNKK